ncbi:MAG: TatD family hydrolase [Mycoplasma sp.]|nr:TatD family hydrolase [Mycoplasma sp.]
MFVDTHTHIFKGYSGDADLDTEIKKIIEEKVSKIINVGIDVETSKSAIELSNKYDEVFAILGIHPNNKWTDDDFKEIDKLLMIGNTKVVAIGETGLDFFRTKEPEEIKKQYTSLEKHLELAIKYNLPVVFHVRDAMDEFIKFIDVEKYKNIKGVMHTYAGNLEQANKLIELGFYISFSGVVTFKSAKMTKEVASQIPLNKILSETDSPFLTPSPYRGKTNHSYYVKYVVQEIARLRNTTVQKIASAILKNTKELFRI